MLRNKIIVITGGAGLIGKEFARAVISNNGTAVLADFNIESAVKVADELQNTYGQGVAHAVQMDITSTDSVLETIDKLGAKYGRIDAVVNNAYPRNANYGRHFFDVTFDDFCENMSVNIGGYFLVSQKFAKYFIEQGHGNIVNIGSIYGVMAPRFEVYEGTEMTMPVEYSAIKSALVHLTKYMAKYLKGSKIRVNTLSLGGIRNNQPEAFLDAYKEHCLNKGMLDTQDVSDTLVYLLSEQSMYVNGQNIVVDDGFSL